MSFCFDSYAVSKHALNGPCHVIDWHHLPHIQRPTVAFVLPRMALVLAMSTYDSIYAMSILNT